MGWPPAPPSGSTIRAVGEVRKGIYRYRIYLILAVISSLFTAGAGVVSNSAAFTGASIPTSIWTGNNTSSVTSAPDASSTGLSIVAGFVALIGFIVLLIAWVSWRGGVRQLVAAAPEFGPEHQRAVEEAERDYGRTVWTYIL